MLKLKPLIVFLLIASCNTSLLSQQAEIDSLLKNIKELKADSSLYRSYAQLFRLHYRRDFEKAKLYLDKELVHAKASKQPTMIAASKNHEGIYSGMTGNDQRAVEVFRELKEYYQELGQMDRVASMHQNISASLKAMGKLKEAMAEQLIALRLREEQGVTGKSLGNIYFTIANIHREIEEYEKSNEWLFKSVKEYEDSGAEEYVAQAYNTIAINYNRLNKVELAKKYIVEAIVFFRKQGNKISLGKCLMALGKMEYINDDLVNSAIHLNEAKDIISETNDIFSTMEIKANLAELNYLNKNTSLAIQLYEEALEICDTINNDLYQSEILSRLALFTDTNNQHKKSKEYYSRYIEKFKSTSEEISKAAIAELEVKYETEKKEKEIVLLEEKGKRDAIIKKGMLGGLVAMLLTFASMIYAIRLRMNRNKLEKEKVEQALKFADKELEMKKAELTGYALQLAHKNEVLENIKSNVSNIKQSPEYEVEKIIKSIDINQNDGQSWDGFRQRFQAIHKDFEQNIRRNYENVTSNDLRLMSLIKMNLSSKEIANILSISPDGVKKARYRLRKKLDLDADVSLEGTIGVM